jgi:hypothetical protein
LNHGVPLQSEPLAEGLLALRISGVRSTFEAARASLDRRQLGDEHVQTASLIAAGTIISPSRWRRR